MMHFLRAGVFLPMKNPSDFETSPIALIRTGTSRMLSPSLRVDVKVAATPDYIVPKPGLKYLDQYIQKWYTDVRPKMRKEIVEALGGR